jgi:HAD superfamily hydrolase (TIGR01490 family)
MTEISIFDVDRTITRRPTYSLFLLTGLLRHAPWRLILLPLLLPVAFAYAFGRISREGMKEAMHYIALGARTPRARAEQLARTFASGLFRSGMFDEALRLIAAERNAGRRVMLATAAPALYIDPLARHLDIDDVIATGGTWDGEWLTHRIAGRNCYGPYKLEMIVEAFARLNIDRSQAHVRFYSDHASDRPVFEWADEAIAVNPSRKMLTLAHQRGWPVLDWRRT